MLWLSFAFLYLAMLGLSLAMSRHHKALFGAAPAPGRQRLLRLAATVVGVIALALCVQARGGEIGTVIWLGQLMLAGVLLGGMLAWRQRWALSLAALLPAGALLQLLV
ncbi:DUF3325 domain-containing protein [Pseudomonas sp. UL073]|uniref:DUF3325 domain-containing protein n=1 Tax=Zestomonas insulae TaxID=2809017 RepID=A0ABS2ICP4_9GAMM|nr:DUF3325 domain-containing protein [Pseudomonas insulae]MBM7060074.1 DUF3325 domain-containing protein [Pseudomonas insulae]